LDPQKEALVVGMLNAVVIASPPCHAESFTVG
jgi:hypothetical protein